jgi:ABC-type antimicrobial peptide transport system permease subunit
MTTIWISLAAAISIFVFGVLGLLLQRLLPEPHTTDRSLAMIGAIVGLFSLLLALVLGTLIGNAFAFYSTQKSEVETFAARVVHLDLALAEYGPETAPTRAKMKSTLQGMHEMFWGSGSANIAPESLTVAAALGSMRILDEYVASLNPQTPAQRQFATEASIDAGAIEQTRLLMSLQLASPISWPLLIVVVSWALILFCGFGLLSRLNATTVVALAIGAFAVGTAVFLILSLSEPFTGLLRLPSGAIEQMLDVLGK